MGVPWKFLLPLLVVLPLGAFVVGSLATTADQEPPAREPIVLRQDDTSPTDPPPEPRQRPGNDDPDDDPDDDEVKVVTPLPVDDHGDPDDRDDDDDGDDDSDDSDDGDDDRDDSDDDGGDGDD